MAATNLFMNWSSVTVAYGATTVTLLEVLDVQLDAASQQEVFFGDARKFPRLIVNTAKTRGITIIGGDVYKLLTIPDDTVVTVTAVLNDAKNGSGSGALTLTLSNAVRAKVAGSGPNNKFAGGSVAYSAFADVNDTDPLAIAQAA